MQNFAGTRYSETKEAIVNTLGFIPSWQFDPSAAPGPMQGLGFIPSWQFDPSAAPGPSLSGSLPSVSGILSNPLFWVAALGLGIWYFDPMAKKKRTRR